MDQWMQKLALLILLVVVGLCFQGSTRGVSCWPPSELSPAHVKYVQEACSRGDATTWETLHEDELPEPGADIKPWSWASQIGSKSNWLLKLVLMELTVVCIVHCLINLLETAGSFDARSPHKDLHQSYTKAPLYVLVQIVAGCGWMIFAVLTILQSDWPMRQPAFLCDFKIRQLGNVRKHTVQCVGQDDHTVKAAFLINFGLALVMTLTKAIHILSAFFIGPFLKLKGARESLMERGLIKKPGQLGVGFAVSDLYFAMLVSGKEYVSPSLGGKPEKDTELAVLSGTDYNKEGI